MATKYLVLSFENAGIVKRKFTMQKEPDFKTVISGKWTRDGFFEENKFDTLTNHDVLNVLLGLTRGVPVPRDTKKMTERVRLSANKELVKYANESYVKVMSGISSNGEPIYEMMASEKIEENSEKEQLLSWSSMSLDLGEDFVLLADFLKKYGITERTHTMKKAFSWMIENYQKLKNDEDLVRLFEKSKLIKTSLESGVFKSKHFGWTGRNFATKCMHNRGIDCINIRSGEIYIPCDDYLEGLLKKGKTCTKLLDGGVVYLSSITSVNLSKLAENSDNIKKVQERPLQFD